MVWLALEPMVPDNSAKALTLAAKAKLPRLQEFVPEGCSPERPRSVLLRSGRFPRLTGRNLSERPRLDFTVEGSGEGGVIRFGTFRNKTATRTHPIKRGEPSVLSQQARRFIRERRRFSEPPSVITRTEIGNCGSRWMARSFQRKKFPPRPPPTSGLPMRWTYLPTEEKRSNWSLRTTRPVG